MNTPRPELPPLPSRLRALPIDERGYPVPRFVQWIDGKPDFRVMDSRHLAHCLRFRSCWMCGESLGRIHAFVVGPMCTANRVSSEPGMHLECATFAVKACPFLVRPDMRRREAGLPEGTSSAGISIRRNPGVTAIYLSKDAAPFNAGNGVLFDLGNAVEVHWYTEGRKATRAEVEASFDAGCPALEEMARADGQESLDALQLAVTNARKLFPEAA